MLKPFLDCYDTVLLDMDGVVTSEEIYWNAAALTVYELIYSKRYFGTSDLDPKALPEALPAVRAEVFNNDQTIRQLKNKSVNNNWDLAWIAVAGALALKTRDFSSVAEWVSQLPDVEEGMYSFISESLVKNAGLSEAEALHHAGLWTKVQLSFQEWFLGNELFEKHWQTPAVQPGKAGLSSSEKPLVDQNKLLSLLSALAKTKRLGIGTGRPRIEAETPLIAWKAMPYLTPDAIVTYDELEQLQRQNPGVSYAKPHPYMFLRGVFGPSVRDADLLTGKFDPLPCSKTLVIGDAACDLFAAKNAGCDFAAVLTGIHGENARGFFEENGADYILRDILELLQ